MIPSKEELKKKTWYRVLTVVAILVIIQGAFTAILAAIDVHSPRRPFLLNALYVWLMFGAVLTGTVGIVYAIRYAILYMVYGDESKAEKPDN